MLKISKIELSGFKSFAGTETIDFERPVTAVVGPNGSGKSNILDAILFAFGEQSPHRLRTSKMDALIFAGAGDAKRLNFTSVKVTFVPQLQSSIQFRKRTSLPGDNGRETLTGGNGNGQESDKDYAHNSPEETVTLERRLYRDGVSEYLLNGENARLKDIDEFFGRFGLGRGAQIAITQGEVERKILANQQEMRSWLVSACGIGLLVDRKKRTEEKLEATKQNLVRVNELIVSTRKRMNSLARERDDAFEYEKLLKKLSVFKLESLRRELADCFRSLGDNRATIDEIRQKLSVYGATSEDAEKKRNEAEKELETARATIETRLTEQSSAQRAFDELESRVKSLEIENRMLRENLNGQMERAGAAETALGSDNQRFHEIVGDHEKLSKALVLLARSYSELKESLDAREKRYGSVRKEYDSAIAGRLDAERRARDYEHRLSAVVATLERATIEKAKLKTEREKLVEALDDANAKLRELSVELEAALKTMRETDAETAAAAEKLAIEKKDLEVAKRRREEVRDALAGVNARLDSLRALEAEAEGFAPGKKALLTDGELKKRVGGARDPWRGIEFAAKYAPAIGLIFSAYEDAIEVGDLVSGARVLTDFHIRGIGRVRLTTGIDDSCLPEIPSKPEWWDDAAVRFYDVVKGNERWLRRLYGETGEVAIVGTLDDALRLIETQDHLSRAVVLDGSVVVSKTEAAGGAPTAGSTVLSRRVTIDELAIEVEKLASEYATAEATMTAAEHAVRDTQAELEVLTENKARYAKEVAVLDERVTAIGTRTKEIALNIDSVGLEIEATEKEEEKLSAETEIRRRELDTETARLKSAEDAASVCATVLADAEREAARTRAECTTAGEELRVSKLNANHLEMQKTDLEKRIRNAKIQLESAQREVETVTAKIDACEKSLDASVRELDDAENALNRAKTALDRARAEAESRRRTLDELKTAARDADENRERFERDLQRFDVARGRLLYRYHDLWKNWHESTALLGATRQPSSTADTDDSPCLVKRVTLAIVNDALTLVKAYYEVEGMTVEEPKPDRTRISRFWDRMGLAEPDYPDDAPAPTVPNDESGEADDDDDRLFDDAGTQPRESESDCESATGTPTEERTGTDDDDESPEPEQMHIMDAAEVMISGWESGGLPVPPNPPSLVEDVEKMGRAALREAIQECDSTIAKLGSVNMKAPVQWNEESARLSFFILQESDVRNALAQLSELLVKLDRETLRKYTNRTEKIVTRFKDYFHFLFGSGDVSINFTEPADVLASGVEIFVTLPGDRRQPLRSLSGGERSLIFLALFLAAHATGEGAFCVMDEADAALDDANILRLGRLLDAIASHTQLILVTHNKRTMELGDGLVGVVGRPKGISRVIPVNLAKAAEYATAEA